MTDIKYSWENDYEKTWEALSENADGFLQNALDKIMESTKNRSKDFSSKTKGLRLSMMRHLFIIIDLSESMIGLADKNMSDDYKPNKGIYVLRVVKKFVQNFFASNPLGQISIIYTCNKRSAKISELSGNVATHERAFETLINCVKNINEDINTKKIPDLHLKLGGEPSLQNSLLLAFNTLKHVSRHTSREILAIFGSLSTCDPGDIHETINDLRDEHIVCSLISLTAEVYVFKRLCKETSGKFFVALDSGHFETLLLQKSSKTNDPIVDNGNKKYIIEKNNLDDMIEGIEENYSNNFSFLEPPPSYMQSEATLIRVGFPRLLDNNTFNNYNVPSSDNNNAIMNGQEGTLFTNNSFPQNTAQKSFSSCACHLESEKITGLDKDGKEMFRTTPEFGYSCPVCKAKYCELPIECHVCNLTLVSAPHLARSYAHLFPPKPFIQIPYDTHNTEPCRDKQLKCDACLLTLNPITPSIYKCTSCQKLICPDCTLFIHELLNSCPGCANQSKNY